MHLSRSLQIRDVQHACGAMRMANAAEPAAAWLDRMFSVKQVELSFSLSGGLTLQGQIRARTQVVTQAMVSSSLVILV